MSTGEHLERLDGVHPVLAEKIKQIFDAMIAIGKPMFVVQGVRTAEYQHTLWLQGRETPGPNVRPGRPLGDKVTNCDGFEKVSNHQAKSDGFGHAVDCAFIGNEPFALSHPWAAYGALGEALGLAWGGRWTSPHDLPHLELR